MPSASVRTAVPMALSIAAALIAFPSAAAPRKDEVEKAADARDKVVCKRFVETGSLVKGYRTCKTKWEWERERENIRSPNSAGSCDPTGLGGGC